MKLLFLLISFVIYLGQAEGDPHPHDDKHSETDIRKVSELRMKEKVDILKEAELKMKIKLETLKISELKMKRKRDAHKLSEMNTHKISELRMKKKMDTLRLSELRIKKKMNSFNFPEQFMKNKKGKSKMEKSIVLPTSTTGSPLTSTVLQQPITLWPWLNDRCCELSTTPLCSNIEGECIPRNETCDGDENFGSEYCSANNLQSCKCCAPFNCNTLSLCETVLEGTCNITCEGVGVTGNNLCTGSSNCKCCLPVEPEEDCPCGQDMEGGCKGEFLPGKTAKGNCEKKCRNNSYPLDSHSCNMTGGCGDCYCCAPLKSVCDPKCVNGDCIGPDNCTCRDGWMGPICDIPPCNPQCVNGYCKPPGVCVCAAGWTGPACDKSCCMFGGICYENQPPNVCTRLTCNNGVWAHEGSRAIACYNCKIYNDPHFISWFNTGFDWHGTCSYSLAQDGTSTTPTFGVYAKFEDCLPGRGGASCLGLITVQSDANSIITMKNNDIKYNNGDILASRTPTFYGSDNSLAIWESTCFSNDKSASRGRRCYCIIVSHGFMVQYCGWSLTIWAYEDLKGNLYGMCGYLSSRKNKDQFTTRDGVINSKIKDFAESWETSTCLPSSRESRNVDCDNEVNRDPYKKMCSDNVKDLVLSVTDRKFAVDNCAFDQCVINRYVLDNPDFNETSPADWLMESKEEATREKDATDSGEDITMPSCLLDDFFIPTNTNQCYYLIREKLNWNFAKKKCEGKHNSRLAEPGKPVEVRKYLTEVEIPKAPMAGSQLVHLGARGNGIEFLWDSDKKPINNKDPLNNTFWLPDRPFSDAKTRCLQLRADNTALITYPNRPYIDGKTNQKRFALCEVVCDPECINGYCIGPNNCLCKAGWTGDACDTALN